MTDPVVYLDEQRRRMKEWTDDPALGRALEEDLEFTEQWGNDQERETEVGA